MVPLKVGQSVWFVWREWLDDKIPPVCRKARVISDDLETVCIVFACLGGKVLTGFIPRENLFMMEVPVLEVSEDRWYKHTEGRPPDEISQV